MDGFITVYNQLEEHWILEKNFFYILLRFIKWKVKDDFMTLQKKTKILNPENVK